MKCPKCGYEPPSLRPKPKDMRNAEIVDRYSRGESLGQIAKRFEISRSRVRQVIINRRKRKEAG